MGTFSLLFTSVEAILHITKKIHDMLMRNVRIDRHVSVLLQQQKLSYRSKQYDLGIVLFFVKFTRYLNAKFL